MKLSEERVSLLAAASKKYESLSPLDKALADSDQRRSYVEGMSGRDPGDLLADEVRRLRATLLTIELDTIERCARACEEFNDNPTFQKAMYRSPGEWLIRAATEIRYLKEK